MIYFLFFFFKQKTAYEMRISDWSSDVCSSDLRHCRRHAARSARGRISRHLRRSIMNPGAPQSASARRASATALKPLLTHVELTWHEKKIEHWIRFGHPAHEQILDRRRRIVSLDRKSTRLNSSH